MNRAEIGDVKMVTEFNQCLKVDRCDDMAEFLIGELIKRLRKQRGISQEELAYPFFNRGYLSRIENGKVMPGKHNVEILLERLGFDPGLFAVFLIDEKESKYQSAKKSLDSLLSQQDFQNAEVILKQLESDTEFANIAVNKQYLLSRKVEFAMYYQENPQKIFKLLLSAIKISTPKFKECDIGEYLLSKEDIDIINKMAVVYEQTNQVEKSINLLYMLKKNFDNRYMDNESKGLHYPMVIYNLTKYLGAHGRFDEAIDLCDMGIKMCIDINALKLLSHIVANKAYCLHEIGDKIACERLLRQVYYTNEILRRFNVMEMTNAFAKEKLGITFS